MPTPPDRPAPPVIFLAFAAVTVPGHVDLPRLADEQRRVRAALDPAYRSGRCEVVEQANITLDEIFGVFQDDRYSGRIAIFHFAGHADSYSLLVQDSQGKALPAGAAGLAHFLSAQSGLQLVALNACSTKDHVQALHTAKVPIVLATHADIPDSEWVVTFAETFYRGLAGGQSIAAAFAEAKAAKWSAEFGARETQDPDQWDLYSVSEAALAWRLPPAPVTPTIESAHERLWVNVPVRPSHRFIGREQTATELVELLTTSHRPAAAITGPAGAGKTALAIEIAHDPRIAAHFADGVLWGSLGMTHEPAALLGQWAEAYGFDLTGVPDVQARAQRLSSIVAGRRVLVVLDDAWDAATSALLRLSCPHVVHLLTTRSPEVAARFASAEQTYALPELDGDAAFTLLQTLAPDARAADPALAKNLVAAVGNLPLGIVLLGGYLRRTGAMHFAGQRTQSLVKAGDPAIRLALAANRLGAETGDEVTLADVVNLGLHGLSASASDAFCALGAFAAKPARFDLPAALAVTGAGEEELGALIDRSLVEIDSHERMALHQVVADVARTQASSQAVQRHGAYYLQLVQRNSEQRTIVEAAYDQVSFALEQLHAASADITAWVLALRSYWERRGLRLEQLRWTELALASTADGNTKLQGILLDTLGSANFALGRRETALQHYQGALTARRLTRDRHGEAVTLNNIGQVYDAFGDKRQALAWQRQARNYLGQGITLVNAGKAYADMGERKLALEHFEQALTLQRALGDHAGEAAALANIGKVYDDLGYKRLARETYIRALFLFRRLGNRAGEASTLSNIGSVYWSAGAHKQAITCYKQALEIALQIGDQLPKRPLATISPVSTGQMATCSWPWRALCRRWNLFANWEARARKPARLATSAVSTRNWVILPRRSAISRKHVRCSTSWRIGG